MELSIPHFFLASIFNNINVKVAFFLPHLFLKSLPVSSVRFQRNRSLVFVRFTSVDSLWLRWNYAVSFALANWEKNWTRFLPTSCIQQELIMMAGLCIIYWAQRVPMVLWERGRNWLPSVSLLSRSFTD